MKHYVFSEIRDKGSCIRFAEQELHSKVQDGRCIATWRGGENYSVAIDQEKWYDHVDKQGGGLLELCALAKFGSIDSHDAIQRAQEYLGEWLRLEEVRPKPATIHSGLYMELIDQGYKEKARYEYKDLNGKLVYYVVRMEHPTKKKQFVQGTPEHWGISDTETILYNWAEIAKSDWAVIVEGEKDAETLKAMDFPATTNSGGALKWKPEFSEILRGKKIIILNDNDDKGREHADIIARSLYGIAAEIRVVQCSQLPKGDVTDFFQKENGTMDQLKNMIQAAPAYKPAERTAVDEAKAANKEPFRNYEEIETTNSAGKTIMKKVSRTVNDMVEDLHRRLLGAPFRIGDELFDQDRETKKIHYLYTPSELFAWMAQKINNRIAWAQLDDCVSKSEFFNALKNTAVNYNAISAVPDYPRREDVYYTYPAMDTPTPEHSAFWGLVDFFNPVDEINRYLLAAFIMAPVFYRPMAARPLWIIDSPDGQGSGKSKVPEMVAMLYDRGYGMPLDISMYDMNKNFQEVVKRILSSTGRNCRILRLDNVTGTLHSSNLAMLVTTGSISGRPAYGRGEEIRPNNLTYVVTVNGASVDTDISSRAYYIMIAKPKHMDASWNEKIRDYILNNRFKIFADIIDMISKHTPFPGMEPLTRMPEFEKEVLQPACGTAEHYSQVLEFLQLQKEETNTDEELARRIEEEIIRHISETEPAFGKPALNACEDMIFIRSQVLEEWFGGATWMNSRYPSAIIRNMAKTRMLAQVDPKTRRWPNHDGAVKRRSGIMWNYQNGSEEPRIISLRKDKKSIEIVSE